MKKQKQPTVKQEIPKKVTSKSSVVVKNIVAKPAKLRPQQQVKVNEIPPPVVEVEDQQVEEEDQQIEQIMQDDDVQVDAQEEQKSMVAPVSKTDATIKEKQIKVVAQSSVKVKEIPPPVTDLQLDDEDQQVNVQEEEQDEQIPQKIVVKADTQKTNLQSSEVGVKSKSNFQKNLERANSITEKYIPQDTKQVSKQVDQEVTVEGFTCILCPVRSSTNKTKIAPITQFKNFMPANYSTMVASHLETDILEMIGKLIEDENVVFDDKDFPCTESSLFGRSYGGSDAAQQSSLTPIKDKIVWVDMEETVEEAHNMQFCDKSDGSAFYTKSMVQGYLNNRDMLNALALVCSNMELFDYLCCQDLPQHADNKLYLFRLYKNKNQKYTVAVDTKIPTLSLDCMTPTPCFSRTEQPNEIWLSLIEKAYAKLNGGYTRLQGVDLREAICDLSGLDPEFINIDRPENVHQSNLNEFLRLCQLNGSIVGFMCRTELKSQVNEKLRNMNKLEGVPDSDRVYIFRECKDGKYTIMDPWFQGATLCASPEKGVYVLSFASLLTIFNCIVVVKDFPDEWRGYRLDINLSPAFGVPSSTNVGWVQNTQYMFQVGRGVPGDMQEVPFVFRLQDLKGVQYMGPTRINGMALFSAGEKENKITTFNQNQLLYMSRANQVGLGCGDNYNYSHQKMGKKFYSLIPFTNQKGETQGTYINLEIYFACQPSKLDFKFKTETFMEYCLSDLPQEGRLRTLRDKIKTTQLGAYNLTGTTDKSLALVPGLAKQFLLINPNVQQQQQPQSEPVGVPHLDDKLRFIQDNLIQESLLGLDLNSESSEQSVIEQVQADIEGVYDFNHFNMGDEGLKVVLPTIIAESSILELRVAGNNLSDASVTSLCYELEKAYHLELKVLDLSANRITKQGAETVLKFLTRMKQLQEVNLQENDQIPDTLLQRIKILCDKRVK